MGKAAAIIVLCCLSFVFLWAAVVLAAKPVSYEASAFPRSLESYDDADADSIWAILKTRIEKEPFNLVATLIFFLATVHTFMTGRFMAIAHKWEHTHEQKIEGDHAGRNSVHQRFLFLFVNISVGGALSNFTAPPVLMVVMPRIKKRLNESKKQIKS